MQAFIDEERAVLSLSRRIRQKRVLGTLQVTGGAVMISFSAV